MNRTPKTYQLPEGWYWDTDLESDGPFATEDGALNAYADGMRPKHQTAKKNRRLEER